MVKHMPSGDAVAVGGGGVVSAPPLGALCPGPVVCVPSLSSLISKAAHQRTCLTLLLRRIHMTMLHV